MTQQEIFDFNKRCAEFLEYEFDELSETYETPHLKLVEPQAFGDEQFSCKLKIYELDFHSDWNWIHEVIDAIEKLDFCTRILDNGMCIECTLLIIERWGNTKKEGVIETINQFLIWYNEQRS